MGIYRHIIVLAFLAASPLVAHLSTFASTPDRDYRMGDDPTEGASAGNGVFVTFDSAGIPGMTQLIDLLAVGGPVYTSVAGRPDGGTGLAVRFDGSSQYLRAARLGLPSTSISSTAAGGTIDYTGISNRGLQFWVQPDGTGLQSLIMDTNQHGAQISENGNFSLRYAGANFESNVAAQPGNWYHVMVVRPNGSANGARMYVDGVAVAAAAGGYNGGDTADLVVGANTAGDDQNFGGGTGEFFGGIIDDLELFVIGSNAAADYGEFDFATDNAIAADVLTGVPGDVNQDGSFTDADKQDFIDGWMTVNLVHGLPSGDINTIRQGDLNFDGSTDLADLAAIQQALRAAGIGAITAQDLAGVPEPSAAVLMLIATTAALGRRRVRVGRGS